IRRPAVLATGYFDNFDNPLVAPVAFWGTYPIEKIPVVWPILLKPFYSRRASITDGELEGSPVI
ncbi:MAG TPA: hypothetical protein VK657_08980, partial [Terriglobales bacterium]|nr:hypothetical protein [Terriglobales bacterium]